ncbi:phage head-tail adaptor, putative, SPP1 family [Sphingomonas guangdongensis]|uniref:Phage head-tail adaptor, putative, SPP1 family n=1 Tax=Sphingomonas guangdongensis TaxID=1141890 RepID=A0A285QYW6_9SPHN|nr:phage head closure protein [Sphingomonas guangdongensis]SOB86764.1 phage head-tail adaptor, putative, SPP1 family [Sphingomonas guangdongensis]
MTIRSGSLDRSLTLSTETQTRDNVAQIVSTWTVVATAWSERLELRWSDVERLGVSERQAAARYRIRWRTGVTVGMRATVDGQHYRVRGVAPEGRRDALVLTLVSE